MIPELTFVEALAPHHVRVRFSDGLEGMIDVQKEITFTGVFEDLRDPEFFVQVSVDPESGTIVWPNGADLDPVVLYARASGREIDELLHEHNREAQAN